MAKNHFGRHVWLIDTIQKHGHIAFFDISSDLRERSAINDDGGCSIIEFFMAPTWGMFHIYKEAQE